MIRRERVDRKHLYTIKCRTALKPETVQEIATSILVAGKKTQIPVRRDSVRSPSSEGHRRGNVPGAGQETIVEYLVPAKHPGARLRPNATLSREEPWAGNKQEKNFRTIPLSSKGVISTHYIISQILLRLNFCREQYGTNCRSARLLG
jgi:hypothetical protein